MESFYYSITTIVAAVLLISACVLLYVKKVPAKVVDLLLIAGMLIQIAFITVVWISIERPPMRTLGETRMWYALFMVVIGFFTLKRWKYSWFLVYCIVMYLVFSLLNLVYPENFDRTLMPALQSIWFVPHVIVYIFAYALLAASSLIAARAVFQIYIRKKTEELSLTDLLKMSDNLVYLGFSFLSPGLIFGALWAKEAWGHYWTWDPKETWAFITWLAYLIYIHFRISRPKMASTALWMLAMAFVFLLLAWMGVNYLPAAQNSVHVY